MNSNSTDTKQIRRHGIVTFILFGCLCVLGIWNKKPIPTYFFAFLCLLGVTFILAPSRSIPVYVGWLKITHFIGRILTILILTMSYYLVITPSAIVKRLLNGPPLPLRPNKQASSYWVEREEPAQTKERFLKRY